MFADGKIFNFLDIQKIYSYQMRHRLQFIHNIFHWNIQPHRLFNLLMMQQANLEPALPVARLPASPPSPKSSRSAWTTIPRPMTLLSRNLLAKIRTLELPYLLAKIFPRSPAWPTLLLKLPDNETLKINNKSYILKLLHIL